MIDSNGTACVREPVKETASGIPTASVPNATALEAGAVGSATSRAARDLEGDSEDPWQSARGNVAVQIRTAFVFPGTRHRSHDTCSSGYSSSRSHSRLFTTPLAASQPTDPETLTAYIEGEIQDQEIRVCRSTSRGAGRRLYSRAFGLVGVETGHL